ncbi:hypothetical protein C5167_011238 [Papaver somniferum]|uniref:Protein kinase domain-containing protein n=1 Tax=Papaver somniferum TaxID=3469 RepID=A0A4Y7K6K0_PAPSO|nr:hypothetical protein C5167_011238 [Papaver somniferum]
MGFSKLFFCSLIFIVCISSLSIHSVAYVSINNITLLGDAYFQENGRICLTPYSPSPSPSSSIGVGRALYNHPIRFLDPSTNSNASFICRFSFYITPFSDSSSSPPLFGDGLTFIITSKKYILGSGFGYMGLSNETSQEEGGMYIAVEFDPSFDPALEDISDNHIGIDINSAMSFASVDSTSMGFDLKNGKRTTVWIEYIDSKKMVKVWLSYTKSRTIRPILATHIDLSMYLEEFMFIGFSASNGKGSAQHVVEKWRFRTYGFLPSVNSFDTRVEGGCFMCVPDDVLPNDTAQTPSTRSRKNELVLGVGGAAFFVSVSLVIGGISWFFMRKKRNGDTGNSRHQRTVYEGHLASGKEVAVKRFHQINTADLYSDPFTNELAAVIGCLKHRNLLQLQGWCCERGELILVYEYMPNGSLDKLLERTGDSPVAKLKWEDRLKIVLGVASALTYLHEECERQIVHRDVKASQDDGVGSGGGVDIGRRYYSIMGNTVFDSFPSSWSFLNYWAAETVEAIIIILRTGARISLSLLCSISGSNPLLVKKIPPGPAEFGRVEHGKWFKPAGCSLYPESKLECFS